MYKLFLLSNAGYNNRKSAEKPEPNEDEVAVLEVLTIPDDKLRQVAEPVAAITPEILKILDDMLDTMYAENGIGLAAPQVGIMKRLIIIDVAQRLEDRRAPIFMINPEIISQSEETWTYEEGCLSIPGSYADVERPEKVTVRYMDRDGKQQELIGNQLTASCLQHEIDHLNGVLFIDYISKLKKSMIVRKHTKRKSKERDAHTL